MAITGIPPGHNCIGLYSYGPSRAHWLSPVSHRACMHACLQILLTCLHARMLKCAHMLTCAHTCTNAHTGTSSTGTHWHALAHARAHAHTCAQARTNLHTQLLTPLHTESCHGHCCHRLNSLNKLVTSVIPYLHTHARTHVTPMHLCMALTPRTYAWHAPKGFCICACTYALTHLCTYALTHLCARMHTYMHTCTHTHTVV